MNRAFSINEHLSGNTENPTTDVSAVHYHKFFAIHEYNIENIKKLIGKLPDVGEIYFIWTLNSFNAFSFIPYTIKHYGTISHLSISTYSINNRILEALIKYIDKGNIENLLILISDSIKYRMPKVYANLEMLVSKRQSVIKVIYGWNHSKVCLIRTANDFYCIEGSGNFSENAQNEQYVIANSESVYNFRLNSLLNASK